MKWGDGRMLMLTVGKMIMYMPPPRLGLTGVAVGNEHESCLKVRRSQTKSCEGKEVQKNKDFEAGEIRK